MATTALCTSFKAELLNGGHVFLAPDSVTASVASGSTAVTSVSSMIGIAVGMAVSGTNIAGNTVVAATSGTGFTLSIPATGAISAGTLTLSGDQFYMALIKPSYSGTYDSTVTNYSYLTGNSDEVSGTGYSAGGVLLTDVSAITSGATAFVSFGSNPTWTSATFSAVAALVYNGSSRLGGVSGRAVGIFDLGGTQTVTASTLTLVIPAATASTALIRLA